MWRENIIHVQKQGKREKIYKTRYGWGERHDDLDSRNVDLKEIIVQT